MMHQVMQGSHPRICQPEENRSDCEISANKELKAKRGRPPGSTNKAAAAKGNSKQSKLELKFIKLLIITQVLYSLKIFKNKQ
jgi:hypothetical protein